MGHFCLSWSFLASGLGCLSWGISMNIVRGIFFSLALLSGLPQSVATLYFGGFFSWHLVM